MANDKLDRLGPLLAAVGERAVADVGGKADGIYLYVEVGDRWISVNLFRDDGDAVHNYDDSNELSELIWDVWAAEPDSEKALVGDGI